MDKSGRTRWLQSESGSFEVDQEGQLIRFAKDLNNKIGNIDWYPFKCRFAVRHLHIPEGVRFVGKPSLASECEGFSDWFVWEDITLPKSLLCIRRNAFHSCVIHRMPLPPSLRQIGSGAFMHCFIDCVDVQKALLRLDDAELNAETLGRVPENELLYGLRCFKESLIRQVRVGRLQYGMDSGSEPEKSAREQILHYLMRDAIVVEIAELSVEAPPGRREPLARRYLKRIMK